MPLFLALLIVTFTGPVFASSMTTLMCVSEVDITATEKNRLTGIFHHADCPDLDGSILVFSDASGGPYDFSTVTSIWVGLRYANALGPNGPVDSILWEVTGFDKDGQSVLPNHWPIIEVNKID